jgi:hypothetical protein
MNQAPEPNGLKKILLPKLKIHTYWNFRNLVQRVFKEFKVEVMREEQCLTQCSNKIALLKPVSGEWSYHDGRFRQIQTKAGASAADLEV